MEAKPSPVPQRIGKYEITQEIGSGGFGHVYRALDPAFDRMVAIKVLNTPDDPDTVRRFRVEAKTVANLHHKNIVTVHDYGENNGLPFLVMEYLDGTTLQTLIGRNALTLLEKVEIMAEVAEGLQHAHARGVIHRDVKPANIMRLSDGSVKIMDFGIARMAAQASTRLTQAGYVVGSLPYMAPEQFGGACDALTDVFAYGVTFYELLTGHNPFASSDPAVTIYKITNTDLPEVSSMAPECPRPLDRILRGALARSREARYSSLSDVLADTRAILSDLRRDQAGRLYSEAGQFVAAGQLDAAKSAVRKVLDLDPVHADARRLRAEIEDALRRRDLGTRALQLLDRAEKSLLERQYDEAAATLDSVRQLGLTDPQLKSRLDIATAQIEQGRRCQHLLDTARENLKNQDLTEAFRAVSGALSADPGNAAGRDLFQEIRSLLDSRETQRRLHEDLSRAEGLLVIGETEAARSLLLEIERRNPPSAEISGLRARAEEQKAQEDRARRLAEAVAEVRALLRNEGFEQALAKIDSLPSEFGENLDLQTLRRHAAERLAVQRRDGRVALLKSEAGRFLQQLDFENAIRVLEAGIAEIGEDAELVRLLQTAIAGKAAEERNRAISRVVEETERLCQTGKLNDATTLLERAMQAWGNPPLLLSLLHRTAAWRDAENLLQQGQVSAAAALLRQAIATFGDDPPLRQLLSRLESQVRAPSIPPPALDPREQATQSLLAQVQSLAMAARLDEAARLLDSGLRDLGPDPRLMDAQRRVWESLRQRQTQAASGVNPPSAGRPKAEVPPAVPPPARRGIALPPWALLTAGGGLAFLGILFWLLMPHAKPSPPPIQISQPQLDTAAPRKNAPPRSSGAATPPGVPGGVAGSALSANQPSVKKPENPVPVRRIRVDGVAQQALILSEPRPVYPPLAIQARVEGVVELNAIIARDGTVQSLTVARGHPFLVQAAVDAVKQWRYKPTFVDGQPVEVQTVIDVNFTLNLQPH
ncbi:MAG TPA: TonB family protein [Bryobacteraceae bacterium]|nr:TonB family protein [Bryobacteraceae bacterium]